MKTQSNYVLSKARRSIRDNTIDSLNPEVWAREALIQLQSDLVLPNLVELDYGDEVGRWGDVVNINRLTALDSERKGAPCEAIVQQNLDSDLFQLELNQFHYVSFKICDGEENRPMRDLIETYMQPAVNSMTQTLDAVVAGQQINFWGNCGGHLEGLDKDSVSDDILETLEVMDMNRVPQRGRRGVLSPRSKRPFLQNELFVSAADSGSTQTLRQGQIGELYGVDWYTAFAQPYVNPSRLGRATAATSSAYAAGATSIGIDGTTEAFAAGEWIVIEGDDIPHQMSTAAVSSGGSGTIVITPGLLRAVADDAVIKKVKAGTLVNGSGYAAPTTQPKRYGWSKRINIDNAPADVIPQVGQAVSFGVATNLYSIIKVYTSDASGNAYPTGQFDILLDRPLDAAIANNVAVRLGPVGSFNMITGPNALAMAIRPLYKPRVGAISSVVSDKGYSLRVVITYDASVQAHIVTLDTLFGIGTYRPEMGAVLFG